MLCNVGECREQPHWNNLRSWAPIVIATLELQYTLHLYLFSLSWALCCAASSWLAVVALILNNHKLWVANVGDSRAVLCYLDGSGKLRAEQISEDHNTRNDKEIVRLVECGLDELSLRSSGRLGVHQNTRSIGDYSIKGGYKDHDILR